MSLEPLSDRLSEAEMMIIISALLTYRDHLKDAPPDMVPPGELSNVEALLFQLNYREVGDATTTV